VKRAALPLLLVSVSVVCPGAARGAPMPADASQPTVDLAIYRRVVEVCFVVKDLDRTVDFWEKLGLRDLRRMGVQVEPNVTYLGKESPLHLKLARGQIGDARIRWIEPVKGTSEFSDFLRRHGDGVHHLTFAVRSPEELDAQVQYFKSKGVEVVMEGAWRNGNSSAPFAELATAQRGGGITFELVCDPALAAEATGLKSANEDPFNKLTQYAFAVKDLPRVGEYYESLGFGSTAHDYIDYKSNPERYYRGQLGRFTLYVGYWRWGTVNFEWIQPADGPSVFEEYLHKHGEGIQHLAVEVPDMDKALAAMNSKGVQVAQSGGFNYQGRRGRFAFVDTEPETGVMIEFIWREVASH
jgi:methylmalonyl-CoA/ethylmalonyl-CoA epimerase